jgi:hypothetical protein
MKRLRFAAYVGVLSSVIVLVGLIVYFWAHLPQPYATFQVLLTFTLAIIVFHTVCSIVGVSIVHR